MIKKLTEEECLEIGGHCWTEHKANDILNEKGNISMMSHLVYYPSEEPRCRTCRHCGKHQTLETKWKDK